MLKNARLNGWKIRNWVQLASIIPCKTYSAFCRSDLCWRSINQTLRREREWGGSVVGFSIVFSHFLFWCTWQRLVLFGPCLLPIWATSLKWCRTKLKVFNPWLSWNLIHQNRCGITMWWGLTYAWPFRATKKSNIFVPNLKHPWFKKRD